MRYIGSLQFTRWCWGYLRREIRVPLPACAVSSIRNAYLELEEVGTHVITMVSVSPKFGRVGCNRLRFVWMVEGWTQRRRNLNSLLTVWHRYGLQSNSCLPIWLKSDLCFAPKCAVQRIRGHVRVNFDDVNAVLHYAFNKCGKMADVQVLEKVLHHFGVSALKKKTKHI